MHLFKRGNKPDSSYYAFFRVKGRAYSWSTGTDDRAKALLRAKDHRDAVMANDYKMVDAQSRKRRKGCFGDVFAILQQIKPDLKEATRRNYRGTMATILRVSGIELDEKTSLSVLDRSVVDAYRTASCGRAPTDGQKRTFNSMYRQAKALFSRPMRLALDKAGIKVPGLDDFMSAPLYRVQETVPPEITQDVAQRVEKAIWQEQDPELKKALLLMFYCGLRNCEVLASRWDWMREIDGKWFLVVGDGAYQSKGKRSRTIPVATEIASHIRLQMSHPIHIIGGMSNEERRLTCYSRAPKFCRANGIPGHKPAYELRKWFGSTVTMRHGLYATQVLMGHKTAQVTSDSYASMLTMPEGISPSLGSH